MTFDVNQSTGKNQSTILNQFNNPNHYQLTIGSFSASLILDDDGHLSVFLKSIDGSKIVDITEDIGSESEVAMRTSTEIIEKNEQMKTELLQRQKGEMSHDPIVSEGVCPLKNIPNNRKSSVPVSHWERYSEGSILEHQFQIDVDDQRESNGQMYIDLAAREGSLDDLLYLSLEIHRLPSHPGSPENPDVPCVHMHFDGDNLAGSFFKTSNKIVFRPENGTTITPVTLDNGEMAYEIDSMSR